MKKSGYYVDGIPREDCLQGVHYSCNWGVYKLHQCPYGQRWESEKAEWATKWSGACKPEEKLKYEDECDEEVFYYDVPP